MTAKRKDFWWGGNRIKTYKQMLHPFNFKELAKSVLPRKPLHWAWSKLLSILCGYGERPMRALVSAIVIVFGLATIYFAAGALKPNTFLDSLYYSAVSFTALGYGGWAPQPSGWIKGLGVVESFVGVFMMALFLVTFTRKMTR
jgi:hypothetical protein